MTYAIKEIFYTLQGEGFHAGRVAVFCRFAGCNLWNGREEDRATAVCQFCDTDFVGIDGTFGGKYATAEALSQQIAQQWLGRETEKGTQDQNKNGGGKKFVVFTGGEPLLQLDRALIDAMHKLDFEIAVETNGTIAPPAGIDWLCVSPKFGAKLIVTKGNELKVVIPQLGQPLDWYETLDFQYFSVQACDGPQQQENLAAAIQWCQAHPKWRLSLQTHKYLNIR